jgi:MFS family permease
MTDGQTKVFYGWWIVVAAFLNLFFIVGIVFYAFPVFNPSFVNSLGFARAEVTQGFLYGFLIVGLPLGVLAGVIIDRIGARWVILTGAICTGLSLLLMGLMTKLWHYELLCIMEVVGYVLGGPIANQVLVARWFREKRGRAMGYAYLGLGAGGLVAPLFLNFVIRGLGWRHAIEFLGGLVLFVCLPLGILITRSDPAEMGLLPDGSRDLNKKTSANESHVANPVALGIGGAAGSANFWLLLLGSTLVIGAVGAVSQHWILFLEDHGYSPTTASRFFTGLLASSLCGRVTVGYFADRFRKKNLMALFYLFIGASIFLLGQPQERPALLIFIVVFGFSMGADYMLIPLVTAECFGTGSLGKLLALIIMGYSLGQWGAPWLVGRLFDVQHSYTLAWNLMAIAGILGAMAIYAISPSRRVHPTRGS